MLTEFDVYMFLHMDNLREAAVAASFPLGLAAAVFALLHVIMTPSRRLWFIGGAVYVLFFAVGLSAIFLPTSKTLFLAKAVPPLIEAQGERELTPNEKSLSTVVDRVSSGLIKQMERGDR